MEDFLGRLKLLGEFYEIVQTLGDLIESLRKDMPFPLALWGKLDKIDNFIFRLSLILS